MPSKNEKVKATNRQKLEILKCRATKGMNSMQIYERLQRKYQDKTPNPFQIAGILATLKWGQNGPEAR